MTEETNHSVDESSDESGLIKALRLQLKDKDKELAARPAREDLESEIRAQLRRESDAAALLIEQGHSAGLAGFMLQKVGDAEVTGETVAEFLKGLGYDTKPASVDGEEPPSPNQQLAEVTSLASRVSAAASNAPADDLMTKIQQAGSQAELNAIMAEAGAVQS